MNRLAPEDRIQLSGGYDYEPKWLKPDGSGYNARVLHFIDNGIEKRSGDERLSAIIQFEEEIEFEGMTGKYGLIMGRWEGQTWDSDGVVHLHLLENEISEIKNFSKDTSRWMESHANYKTIKG